MKIVGKSGKLMENEKTVVNVSGTFLYDELSPERYPDFREQSAKLNRFCNQHP